MDSGTVIDGVHRLPENGVKVIVIGGGVGGLATALECWRKGCEVVVLEKTKKLSRLGDFFTITPPGLTTLDQYPSMFKDYHEAIYDCSIHMYSPSGVALKSTMSEWRQPGVITSAPKVDVSFLKRRPVFAKMQLDQLIRLGVPVQFDSEVVSVCEEDERVIVRTAKGEELSCDICVGANGIVASIDGFDAGPAVAVQDSGYAIARVAFPCSTIKPGSLAAGIVKNVDKQPEFRTYVADDVHVILFLTKDYVAWTLTHPCLDSSKESWDNLHEPDAIVAELEKSRDNWDPAVLDFMKQTPNKVVDWKLRWRDSQKQWTSDRGRLVRLGDAAHSFFPTAGNGAVQALEDATSLAECLRIGGKENIRWATKVHNELRFQRVSILQQTGFVNRDELHHADVKAIENEPEHAHLGFFRIGRWVWAHDPEKYARDHYAQCLDAVKEGREYQNTNIPPGHVYTPWTLESENKRIEAGIPSDLKQNGYWGL